MSVKCRFFLVVIVVLQSVLFGNGDRTKDKMYETIHSTSGCFRRMNATHQIGCSSKRGGSLGVVHYCDTVEDLDFILKNGTAGPYIPILPAKLFHRETVNKIKRQISQIAGVIVHPNNETLSQLSHEDVCPNNRFNIENTCKKPSWNPWGTGLLYEDLPFPMFYVDNATEVLIIKLCFQGFNNYSFDTQRDRSLCSLQLKSFMYATTNTPVCQRRSNIVTNLNPVRMCDPLGDYNIWGFLFPLVTQPPPIYVANTETNKYYLDDPVSQNFDQKPLKDVEYIVISARLDTTSMFDKTAGAENPVTGMVTLLMVAKLLKQIVPRDDNIKKNVLFVFFNGETYDYIGSQRLLYDMETDSFPASLPEDNDILPLIRSENISLFIELSQLSKGDSAFVHYLRMGSDIDNKVTNFTSYLSSNSLVGNITPVPNSLPPSSLHTFLRSNLSIPGLVITNHRQEYKNKFYNSLFDTDLNIDYKYRNGSDVPEGSIQKYVGDVALTVAKSVYQEIKGEAYKGDITVDYGLVDELFHCYLQNFSCKVHSVIVQNPKFLRSKQPDTLYVGVDISDNRLTPLIRLTLAWLTGDIVGPGGTNCTNRPKNYAFSYYSMAKSLDNPNDTYCYRAVVNTSEAVSPAFIIEDYDWSSNLYSSWTESQWVEMGVRLFLKPSAAHENMTLAIGSMSLIFSFVFVYFIKSRSNILFASPLSTDGPADC